MTGSVRLGDGVRIDVGGEPFAFDARDAGEAVGVLSHAHGDHLYEDGAEELVCSALTAALAGVRRDGPPPTPVDHPAVELVNAGHVAGSRAALLTDPEDGRTYCYTGDVCTRDRFYLEGFEPPDADVLVVESTFGSPAYVFPEEDAVHAAVVDWLDGTMDRPVVLFGYALGRAQKLQRLVDRSERDRLLVTDAISRLNGVIEGHLDVTFGAAPYGDDVALGPGDALVLPMTSGRLGWIEDLVERSDAVTAGFSGWAVDDSFVYRRGLDRGFPLSDHCDHEELLALVAAVDPETVYTHHGFADDFATTVAAELGVEAVSLKRNQRTLTDF